MGGDIRAQIRAFLEEIQVRWRRGRDDGVSTVACRSRAVKVAASRRSPDLV